MNAVEAFEAARARRVAAEERVEQCRAALAELDAEHAELEAGMGEMVLADPSAAAEVAADLAGLRDRRLVAEATLRAAEAAVPLAVSAERAAEAAELRRQADAKRAELADLEERTAGLVAQLVELQGCGWAPASMSFTRPDGSLGSTGAATRSDRLRRELYEMIGRAFVLDEEAQGRTVPVPMGALEGRPDFGSVGRTLEENRATRERRAAEASAPAARAGLVDRAPSLVKG